MQPRPVSHADDGHVALGKHVIAVHVTSHAQAFEQSMLGQLLAPMQWNAQRCPVGHVGGVPQDCGPVQSTVQVFAVPQLAAPHDAKPSQFR